MDLIVRRRMGYATWIFGGILALAWGGFRARGVEVRGVGFANPVLVSPYEPGRLSALPVPLLSDVTPGQIVAELDTAPLLEEQAALEAEAKAVEATSKTTATTLTRQFASGNEASLANIARIKTMLRADQALAKALRERVERERSVAEAGGGPRAIADDLERELHVVEARVNAAREELAIAERIAANTEARAGSTPGVNEWEAEAARKRVEQVQGRISRSKLSVGIEGQVAAIYAAPGDWVIPGVPILQINAKETREVVGYLPFDRMASIQVGEEATVVRANGEVLSGKLASVGTGPVLKPQVLWFDPRAEEFGVPFRIQLDAGAVGPNEPVSVRL